MIYLKNVNLFDLPWYFVYLIIHVRRVFNGLANSILISDPNSKLAASENEHDYRNNQLYPLRL